MTSFVKNAVETAQNTPKSVLFAAIFLPGGALAFAAYLIAKTSKQTQQEQMSHNDSRHQ